MHIYPEDRPSILKQVMRIKNSDRAHDAEFEFRMVHKDERIRWIKELYQKFREGMESQINTRGFTILPRKKRQKKL